MLRVLNVIYTYGMSDQDMDEELTNVLDNVMAINPSTKSINADGDVPYYRVDSYSPDSDRGAWASVFDMDGWFKHMTFRTEEGRRLYV